MGIISLQFHRDKTMRVNHRTIGRALGAACALAMFSGTVAAAPLVFAGLDNRDLSGGGSHANTDAAQAAFVAAALAEGGIAVQNFDTLALGTPPANFAVGSLTASLTSTATDHTTISTGPTAPQTFAVSGTQFLDTLTDRNTTFFSIAFSEAVSGFGFHITDASDWFGNVNPSTNLVVTLKYATGNVTRKVFDGTAASSMVSGNLGFWGVVDNVDPLLGFSISNAPGSPQRDAIGIDNLSIALVKPAAAVPVPTSVVLMLSALGGMVSLGRRRRTIA